MPTLAGSETSAEADGRLDRLRAEIAAAEERMRGRVFETPLRRLPHLDGQRGRVWGKLECWQETGSFKLRGATNKLMLHEARARAQGVVTASTGNHGLAVATAAARLDCPVRVFVPATATPEKRRAIELAGARLIEAGADCVDAEAAARKAVAASDALYVSPYNDAEVVAGQGTTGLEIHRQLGAVPSALVVALGGGGLISGTAAWLRGQPGGARVQVIAASPARSPAMHECLKRGAIVEVPCHDTLSDGTAGGVEPGSITFELCASLIDDSHLVEEAAIATELRAAVASHLLVEGAAATAFAVARDVANRIEGDIVVVACGSNIAADRLRAVLVNGD